jgi:signal transduction histidine kinase
MGRGILYFWGGDLGKNSANLTTHIMLFIIGGCTFVAGLLLGGGGPSGSGPLGAGLLVAVALVLGALYFSRGRAQAEPGADLAQAATARARVVLDMAQTIGSSLDYQTVVDAAMDIGTLGLRDVAQKARLVSLAFIVEGDHLRLVSTRRLPAFDQNNYTSPARAGALARALQQAEAIYLARGADDPELSFYAGLQDAQSILVVPLRANFRNYGVLVFGTPEPNAFNHDHAEMLSTLGSQATLAMQNAVLYQKLRAEKEKIVEIEEDARKKLARDLHDGPTQTVSLMAMRVNYIRVSLNKPNVNVQAELEKVEELAHRTAKDIRHMLFTLRPLLLENQGLVAALGELRKKMHESYEQNVVLQVAPGAEELIDAKQQGSLFYIVEEAVNNARKHAQAPNIYVRVGRRDNNIVFEVQDDGVGFDVSRLDDRYEERGSLGMVNMRERAELIEGVVRVESARGKGTRVTVSVPITPARAAAMNGVGTKTPTGQQRAPSGLWRAERGSREARTQ